MAWKSPERWRQGPCPAHRGRPCAGRGGEASLALKRLLGAAPGTWSSGTTRMSRGTLAPGGGGGHDIDLRRFAVDGMTLLGRLRGFADGKLLIAADRQYSGAGGCLVRLT